MPLPVQLEELEALIGAFQLAPERALSCILDVLEGKPPGGSLHQLLRHFDSSRIVQVLGFKLQSKKVRGATPAGVPPFAARCPSARWSTATRQDPAATAHLTPRTQRSVGTGLCTNSLQT